MTEATERFVRKGCCLLASLQYSVKVGKQKGGRRALVGELDFN